MSIIPAGAAPLLSYSFDQRPAFPISPEQDVLNQCLVVALPDPLTLCQDSPTPRSPAEMDSLLLLILGAAVQCSQKEHVIGSIKNLPTELQHEFVEKIQEVSEIYVDGVVLQIKCTLHRGSFHST